MHEGNSAPFQHSLFPELPEVQSSYHAIDQIDPRRFAYDTGQVATEDFDDGALPSAEGRLL